jgi:hypothetical protein
MGVDWYLLAVCAVIVVAVCLLMGFVFGWVAYDD